MVCSRLVDVEQRVSIATTSSCTRGKKTSMQRENTIGIEMQSHWWKILRVSNIISNKNNLSGKKWNFIGDSNVCGTHTHRHKHKYIIKCIAHLFKHYTQCILSTHQINKLETKHFHLFLCMLLFPSIPLTSYLFRDNEILKYPWQQTNSNGFFEVELSCSQNQQCSTVHTFFFLWSEEIPYSNWVCGCIGCMCIVTEDNLIDSI